MRLPESVTRISPVGEVIEASGAGETLLSAAVEGGNNRLFVSDADEDGLSRWEKDYGLADWSGADETRRRARIRAAMAGGQTLTREKLKALAVNVGGAEEGEVAEDFAAYAVEVTLFGTPEQLNSGLAAFRDAVARQKPAHLRVSVQPTLLLRSERGEARHGGVLRVLWAKVCV